MYVISLASVSSEEADARLDEWLHRNPGYIWLHRIDCASDEMILSEITTEIIEKPDFWQTVEN